MARRSGIADLPLHGGRVPAWLAERMAKLGAIVCQAIVHHYGRDEFLRRLSHPFWFQSFGAVMGMDWRSSGITTSVIGALKHGLALLEDELGIHVCGGRGRHSRRTPDELTALGDRLGIDAPALTRASRLVAKVDSAAVQDCLSYDCREAPLSQALPRSLQPRRDSGAFFLREAKDLGRATDPRLPADCRTERRFPAQRRRGCVESLNSSLIRLTVASGLCSPSRAADIILALARLGKSPTL